MATAWSAMTVRIRRRKAARRAGFGMRKFGSCRSGPLQEARADALDATAGFGDPFVDSFDACRDEVPRERAGADAARVAESRRKRRVLEEPSGRARKARGVARRDEQRLALCPNDLAVA